ncbi:Zn(II)2Cys6 transcription factor [Aspergillus alliaceus]|uniref:Zn(II)2Cys6 transcription factor n=1 Tax=Petromyces alliaceus TaxID=209559 RepID=UPI0012A75A86|nr:uncharacterized protein BDW43DRAFT_263101 [Aspergillus alliaceus]KAB8238130.1 hypothetical protein BDW43DRAFT_263101 [Aspergillus alliaceus]
MPRVTNHPVKAACLACRSSKTRCDGQHPCKPCFERNRGCFYRPSRRGGPRRSTKNDKEVRRMSVPCSSISSSHPSNSGGVLNTHQTSHIPGTGDPDSAHETDPSLRHIIGLLTPFSGEQNLSVDPGLLWSSQDTGPSSEIENPVLRVYTSEEDIANAYYIYIHPYLSLLPPPVEPQYEDKPKVFQPPPAEAGTVDQSCLPYWPMSSLTLALSAILSLIPPPQDMHPSGECHVWMRRSYARLYAQAALNSAEKEIDDLVTHRISDTNSYSQRVSLHCEVPFQLHPVLALIALSIYEYCQYGNVSRMRTRANQAITTAMDLGLHRLDSTALEAQRRAWWSAVSTLYHTSVVQVSSPIITAHDPRITTPYPVLKASIDGPDPWPLLLKAQEAFLSVSDVLEALGLVHKVSTEPEDLPKRIYQLDSHIMSLAAESEFYMGLTRKNDAEGLATQCMGSIAYVVLHSARIRLHRFRAFMDIPLFVEKHCDLTAINDKTPYPEVSAHFEAMFPFTEQQSSIKCLKSSLAVARAFRNLPCPEPSSLTESPDTHAPSSTTEAPTIHHAAPTAASAMKSPGTIPFFKCAAMQASYSLFMLIHRIRAAIASDRLSVCYPLIANPEPVTEVQDARRLLEELRHAIECLKYSLEMDVAFEGIAAMCRGLNAVYLSIFSS